MSGEMRPRLLFVDDEAFFSKRYRAELSEHFDVRYYDRPEVAQEVVVGHIDEFDVVVLDVMMPPPAELSDVETDGGYSTGLWLLKLMREHMQPRLILPTVLLTNRSPEKVRDGLRARSFDPKDPLIMICFKADTPARDLPQCVRDVLCRQMPGNTSE